MSDTNAPAAYSLMPKIVAAVEAARPAAAGARAKDAALWAYEPGATFAEWVQEALDLDAQNHAAVPAAR